jgi:protein-S-isoprenylcysteine O-methyltransferase Ste14
MVYGLSELYSVATSVVNTAVAKRFDVSAVGILLPVLYCCGYVVFPSRTNPAHWLDLAAVIIGVARFGVIITFGTSYSNGLASWVRLCDVGPYAWIRHPQAASGLLLRLVFIIGNLSWANVATGVVFLTSVLTGMWIEERFLSQVDEWRSYSRRVPWRLLPGVW